jgi:hypothetical protein
MTLKNIFFSGKIKGPELSLYKKLSLQFKKNLYDYFNAE